MCRIVEHIGRIDRVFQLIPVLAIFIGDVLSSNFSEDGSSLTPRLGTVYMKSHHIHGFGNLQLLRAHWIHTPILPKVKNEPSMKLQPVEKKIKDGKDQSCHLESGKSVSPLALPLSKIVPNPEKSKQGKVMAHSLKSNKDFLQNSIRKRKLSGESFLFDPILSSLANKKNVTPKVEKPITTQARKLQEKTEGYSEEKPSVKSSTPIPLSPQKRYFCRFNTIRFCWYKFNLYQNIIGF